MENNVSSVLLIFQAPGIDEWKSGKPISSTNPRSAGVRIASALGVAGRSRKDYNITNTVQCFPGKREPRSDGKSRDKAPTADVRLHCREWLRQDIEKYQYKRIVVFGSIARKVVWDLGYRNDPRFVFSRHPTGGISIARLSEVLCGS